MVRLDRSIRIDSAQVRGTRRRAVATADFVSRHLHGREATYRGRSGRDQPQPWANRPQGHVKVDRDAFVVFDNTDHAVRDALDIRELLGA